MTLDQKLGGLLGLLVGDAFGVPYEFHDPRDLPPVDALQPDPPPGFRRAHAATPPLTWSDDGAHALALLDTLLAADGWDPDAFAARLVGWCDRGEFAVDRRVFDIGIQTRRVVDRLRRGVPARESGLGGERDNGNGSLMRVLPVALWSGLGGPALLDLAAETSAVTHAHPRSRLCCALAVAWARAAAERPAGAFEAAMAQVEAWCPPAWRDDWAVIGSFGPPGGSGYVVDTIWSARAAVEGAGDYASAVRRAVAFGHDTDTTACVAGGIAGIVYGVDAIPAEWRRRLRGAEVLRPRVARWLGPAAADRLG
jgi:ADP-ribosyl-[dinitrogen reductase] hydrolase